MCTELYGKSVKKILENQYNRLGYYFVHVFIHACVYECVSGKYYKEANGMTYKVLASDIKDRKRMFVLENNKGVQ